MMVVVVMVLMATSSRGWRCRCCFSPRVVVFVVLVVVHGRGGVVMAMIHAAVTVAAPTATFHKVVIHDSCC